MASRKSHSWWWNSYTTPRNSKWLSENIEEMDRLVNEMLRLIEEDGDSFAKKAEMYYQRRPQLISHVKDFYHMYRAIVQRFDYAIGDLAKNIPIEIQSQASANWPEVAIEAAPASLPSSPVRTPEPKVNHPRPHWRAAGFGFFLGSGRSSDRSRKGSDESSSESGSESDYSKAMDLYENSFQLEMRIIGLENELHEARDKLQEHKNGPKEQSEHFLNREISDLSSTTSSFTELRKQSEKLQADLPDHEVELRALMEAMEAAAKQSADEISSRDHIIKEYRAWLGAVLDKSMRDNSSLEQEQTILELRAMAAHSSKRLLQEKYAVEAKLSSLMVSSNSYWSKLQVLEKRVKQLEAEKSRVCAESAKQVLRLESEKEELRARMAKLVETAMAPVDESLRELKLENAKLMQAVEGARKGSAELETRVRELEDEVERQGVVIMDGAERKREAIRQLCFSIEHYRVGYLQLCKWLQVKNGRPVIMAM